MFNYTRKMSYNIYIRTLSRKRNHEREKLFKKNKNKNETEYKDTCLQIFIIIGSI